jgi:hypothetical protein
MEPEKEEPTVEQLLKRISDQLALVIKAIKTIGDMQATTMSAIVLLLKDETAGAGTPTVEKGIM